MSKYLKNIICKIRKHDIKHRKSKYKVIWYCRRCRQEIHLAYSSKFYQIMAGSSNKYVKAVNNVDLENNFKHIAAIQNNNFNKLKKSWQGDERNNIGINKSSSSLFLPAHELKYQYISDYSKKATDISTDQMPYIIYDSEYE